MKTIEMNKATKPLSQYAKGLGTKTILLTVNHKPVAALVSLRKMDKEMLRLSTNPKFLKIIERAREEFRAGKKLSLAAMKREVSQMKRDPGAFGSFEK